MSDYTKSYSSQNTAILVVDPFNDFLSEARRSGAAIPLVAEKRSLFGIDHDHRGMYIGLFLFDVDR